MDCHQRGLVLRRVGLEEGLVGWGDGEGVEDGREGWGGGEEGGEVEIALCFR